MNGSIRRRGKNSWEVAIFLGRDENGRLQRKYVNVKGKKADAERRKQEMLATLDRGLPLDGESLTVSQFMDRWFESYVIPNTRPSTAVRYELDIRLHIKPRLGELSLQRLGAGDVQAFVAGMLETKSPRSVRHAFVVLKEALKYAGRWGLVYRNVADLVDAPSFELPDIMPPLGPEVRRIFKVADEGPYGVMIRFAANTGCRRGEVLALKWSDCNLDQGSALIRRALQRQKGVGLVFTLPKSKKSRRSVALNSSTVDMLRVHQGDQLLEAATLGNAYDDQGLVFPGPFGRPLGPETLTHNFKLMARKANLPDVRLHDLRHFSVTTALAAGTPVNVVSDQHGHATPGFTLNTYGHVIPGQQREAAARVEEALAE